MDFMLALNVTIYGLGIVFLALLILMFAIMVLTKAFSVVTGTEILAVPTAGPVSVTMSVSSDGGDALPPGQPLVGSTQTGRETLASGVPGAAAPDTAVASVFEISTEGQKHRIEVTASPSGSTMVVVDGAGFEVRRDATDARKFFVGGKAHTVEVRQSNGNGVVAVVDGVEQKIDLPDSSAGAEAAAAIPVFKAGTFEMLVSNARHQVELKNVTQSSATVLIDGASFQVERANGRTVVVNGTPHVVEVKERSGGSAGILVDGSAQTVRMIGSES